MESNKILFNFIWKGKDKVKRPPLISDVEKGGLRAPHLESTIKTYRISCYEKFVNSEQSSWRTILLHYLRPVGGKLVLGCRFDIKKLPIKLPKFKDKCFQIFVEHSNILQQQPSVFNNTIAGSIFWNNKHICADKKSGFHRSLFEKGIITLEDLVSESNDLIVMQFSSNSHFTPTEVFLHPRSPRSS